MPDLTASLQAELPGVTIAPMSLRGRAIGLLLALRARREPLIELGRLGAAAMELAGGYTDVIDSARRRKKTHAAAELQQSLLPPRIARMGGGEVAGSVLPTYEVGGDWFDYVENRDGAWLAIADATGRGTAAGALGAIALAALRSARRSGQSVEAAAQAMHQVIYAAGSPEFFVTAIIARWHAVYSVFSWINCGHPPPLLLRADDSIEQLVTEPALPLGLFDEERRFSRHQRRLEEGERLILHSDGITARRTADGLFGLDGIERAVAEAGSSFRHRAREGDPGGGHGRRGGPASGRRGSGRAGAYVRSRTPSGCPPLRLSCFSGISSSPGTSSTRPAGIPISATTKATAITPAIA